MSRFAVALAALLSLAAAAIACVAPANVDEPVGDAPLAIDTVRCMQRDDCASTCEAAEQRARAELPAPAYTSSRCELVALATGGVAAEPAPTCLCFTADQEEPAVVLSPASPDSCLVYARDRSCLYHTASLTQCDLDRPEASCESTCRELERRQSDDALRAVKVRARAASCEPTGCRCVLDINDTCFVDDWVDGFDCEKTDGQILREFDAMARGE